MAQDFAKKFYNSRAWKICRAAYIALVFGLCERCGKPGYIVHHKVYLTPQNINDPAIALNHEFLEHLCQDCHNGEHHGSHEPVVADGLAFDSEGNLIQKGR
ncbi:MAG: HNH endonuclease [Candidatus Cohnella colombiensis]|uniref:HNH endonuclease n=1 Tax=Candidatus Cohnella colombiensis TaxID=3121368 RepID=A0AA95JEK0_9BACL|nr:MAG: HNH endonuclease [Cohnella sp.]